MSVFRMSSALATALAAVALTLAANFPARAAGWQRVIAGATETIDIDKSRFLHGDDGTTGWSRIILGREVNDPGGVYNAIHAQNLYDCSSRRFTTLRRVYFNGDVRVREEPVSRQRANSIQVGSIDERLLNEACRARTVAEVKASADPQASDLHNPDRPSFMYADMRTRSETSPVRAVPVADAAPKLVAPAATAQATAPVAAPVPATVAPPPPGERPRHITLPPIDKAAADLAAANAGQKSAAPVAAAKTAPKPEAKPTVTTRAAAAPTESAEDRRIRELQYATSGPRKPVRRKPVVEHAAVNPAVQMHVHWSYDAEGAPANWAKLRSDYATCATGRRQSPIDIRDGVKVSLENIRFEYKPTQFRIVDNGHTLQVSVGEGLAMNVMGKRYELVQFHFHRPSEERVDGRSYDMVVHLVHKNDDGQLAVLAVLLEKGTEHPLVQTLWNNMPLERDMDVSPREPIDLMQLLPENRSYWTYMGSLTTPPCTEGVLWMVMKQPLQVSAEQVSIFGRLYRNNARPVQPLHGRLIKESR